MRTMTSNSVKYEHVTVAPLPAAERQGTSYANELNELRRQIENVQLLFGMENDEDLLDAAIYQMKALQARQRYLIKRAKAENDEGEQLCQQR